MNSSLAIGPDYIGSYGLTCSAPSPDPPGWTVLIHKKPYTRDEVEQMSDPQIESLINSLRDLNFSAMGEHIYMPTVLENILLKRQIKALTERVNALETKQNE
jgi:hypothetical protein